MPTRLSTPMIMKYQNGKLYPDLSMRMHDPHFGGLNGDVQSGLATMVFKNVEQLEYFNSRILILQQ